jgi:putative AdoMet-dependent methyltransferase
MTNNPPKWLYNDHQQVGTDYTDIAHVEAYDQQMAQLRDIEQEIENLIHCLDLKPDQTILEFGTGTGEFAIEAAKHCAVVHALDVSPTMLGYARQKAEQQGMTNIQFHHAGFLTHEHQGKPLDAVVSQLALHHLPDFWKMVALQRIFEMLIDGGKFYLMDTVYSFKPEDHESFFNNWLEMIKETAGEDIAQDTEIAIREEFTTIDWIMEGLLSKAGFQIEKAEYPTECLAVYVCIKPAH